MANLEDYINHVKTSRVRKPLIKLEFLRSEDESPLEEIVSDLRLDGSLNIKNKNGVRRTMSLTLDNTLNKYFPSLDSNIWLGKKVKLYMGLEINGEDFFLPQGVFVHDDPTINNDSSVTINTMDKYALLDGSLGGELSSVLIIPNTTTLGNTIRTVMTISQDPHPPIIDIALDSESIPYEIIKEKGDTIGSILEELAFAFSANVFYNEDGYLVFEKDTTDSSKGSIWEFNADLDSETNYQSNSSQYKLSEVYNAVTVTGDNVNGLVVEATVKNESLLSDTSIPNIGFERVLPIDDDIIYTVAFAEQRCLYELKRVTNVLTQGRISSLSLFHFDVDKVVETTDSRQNIVSKRVLLDSISIPFSNSSSMSLTVVDTFDIEI